MNFIVYIANALVMPPAMFFVYNFYALRGREINFQRLYVSLAIIVLTAIVTSLQFVFPEIIPALDRNKDALLSGELWRLFTPLFIQPAGFWQCLFNGIFFLSFLPIAEHLYGRRVWLIYFGAGLVGQLANYYWNKGGGGSSTALYGTIGALYLYILLQRHTFPSGYIFLSIAGFLGAGILCFFEDGHAPALLAGGMIAWGLRRRDGPGVSSRAKIIVMVMLLIFAAACGSKKSIDTPRPDADNGGLFLPDGFGALVVVDSLGLTRHLAVHDNGDIYVKMRLLDGDSGNVALRDTNQDGKADIIQRFGDYLNDGSFATEMRIHNGYLYFSSELVVYRQQLTPGKLIPDSKLEVILVDQYPIRWHNAKSLAFDNEGGMYVTFSAPTNVCEDWSSVAAGTTAGVKGQFPCEQLSVFGGIWRFDENKLNQIQSQGKRFATGLRSVVAISWNADDNSLYAVQHGRDYLNSHAPEFFTAWQNAVLPAEELVKIGEGDDFGWPYTYYDEFKQKRMVAPEYGGDGVREATGYANPLMGLPAHWAPNDMLFYKGDQFPERYKHGAFIAFHGSTNRAPYPQGGYVVGFVPFKNGKPTGKWEVFADGFAGVDTVASMSDAKYRPMGLAEGPDGSLYLSESKKGKIWRIMFKGDRTEFNEATLSGMEKRKSRTYLKIPDVDNDIVVLK